MDGIKISLLVLAVLSLAGLYQCGRYGGSRGGSSRGGSRPSYSRPSYHPSPSYHPAPSYHPPSYHPAPSYRPPSYSRPSPAPRPSPPPRAHTSRPSPPAYEPIRTVTSRPLYNQPTHRTVTSRPTYNQPTHRPATSRPIYHQPTHRTVTSRTSHRPYTQPTRRYSTARPTGWSNLPPRPGSVRYPQGPPRTGYTTGNQPQKIKIVNKYNYHYPGYYSLPQQHYAYPGYYFTPSYYHYSSHDTGSTALGLYLGYSLGRLTTPTYYHSSFYDGYRPRYDHYTVHHYYHNKESVPQNQEIRPNAIVGCVGDSAGICPSNTTSLCTSSGALMCVVNAAATMPCSDNKQLSCVKSTISCVNNTADECKNSHQNTTSISIPCVSNAQIYGDLKFVNNTIIVDAPADNSTTTTTTPKYSTKYPITIPEPPPTQLLAGRRRREVPQNFCVTIMAVPAEKTKTEGEEFFNDFKFIASSFFDTAWN